MFTGDENIDLELQPTSKVILCHDPISLKEIRMYELQKLQTNVYLFLQKPGPYNDMQPILQI